MTGTLVGILSWCDRACVNVRFCHLCDSYNPLSSLFEAGADFCDGDCCEQNQAIAVSVHASCGMFSSKTVKFQTYLLHSDCDGVGCTVFTLKYCSLAGV